MRFSRWPFHPSRSVPRFHSCWQRRKQYGLESSQHLSQAVTLHLEPLFHTLLSRRRSFDTRHGPGKVQGWVAQALNDRRHKSRTSSPLMTALEGREGHDIAMMRHSKEYWLAIINWSTRRTDERLTCQTQFRWSANKVLACSITCK